MSLKDLFRLKGTKLKNDKMRETIYRLCEIHIDKMMDYFNNSNVPLLEWAEPRFRQLSRPAHLDWVAGSAISIIGGIPGKMIVPVDFKNFDSWTVGFSVYPSAQSSEFLSSCPLFSFENLMRITRERFRIRVKDWENRDFAHWILLLDMARGSANILLFTAWNINQQKQWSRSMAPVIIPVELMKENIEDFIYGMIQDDRNHEQD